MKSLYTIVFDPTLSGEWKLFDRVFYVNPSVAITRCYEYNNNDIFKRFKVVKVDFTFLDLLI